MELGQRLRQARQAAGLSQRQLCGETITRNMLSQIENGTARPSMDTLRFLAERLGKPVSYFLEEQVVVSPNQPVMEQGRAAFAAGEYAAVLEALEEYRKPDPVFDWEQGLLLCLSCMALAEEAVSPKRLPYARQLLERAGEAGRDTVYYTPELERGRLLLLAQLEPMELPADDRELLLRAEGALKRKDPLRAGEYLDAAENKDAPRWNFLRGQVYFARESYTQALQCFQAAQKDYPRDCTAWLEHCCRELKDYRGAYFYACQLRELDGEITKL